MADLTQVGQALVTLIAGAAYPNGTDQPSVGNCDVLVHQGWPIAEKLTADLKAGKVHISVFPRPGDVVTSEMMGDMDWCEESNDGTEGISAREVRRQTRSFQITIWAGCFEKRDPIAQAIDLALALVSRLELPDGTTGILDYQNSAQDDDQQKNGVYRRDLFYSVNYPLIQRVSDYTVKQVEINITGSVTP